MSCPSPAQMTSSPLRPKIRSLPPRATMTSLPLVPMITLLRLVPTLVAGKPLQVGPVARPKFQSLAIEVRTVICTSPSPSSALLETQGSGEAVPGAPLQAGTTTPFLNIWIVFWFSPVGMSEESIRKTRTSGSVVVAGGAVMLTCCPRKPKPVGGVPVVGDSLMDTAPPPGEVTEVSTGSAAVAPSPSVSGVAVPAGGTTVATLSVGVGVVVGG